MFSRRRRNICLRRVRESDSGFLRPVSRRRSLPGANSSRATTITLTREQRDISRVVYGATGGGNSTPVRITYYVPEPTTFGPHRPGDFSEPASSRVTTEKAPRSRATCLPNPTNRSESAGPGSRRVLTLNGGGRASRFDLPPLIRCVLTMSSTVLRGASIFRLTPRLSLRPSEASFQRIPEGSGP